ncbi:MAG: DUF2851 family protein [Candidatus Brocadiia bacterium]
MNWIDKYLSGAGCYQQLRQKSGISRGQFLVLDRENDFEGITERFVQYLWAEREPRNIKYKTVAGRAVEVVSPGFWNARKGPDFTAARIRIGGKVCSGDVEIHLYSSDWYGHKHHLDKTYDRTILHIAFWQDAAGTAIKNSTGKIIPQLILSPFMSARMEEMEKLLELIPETMNNYRYGGAGICCPQIKDNGRPVSELLEMAGQDRLLSRINALDSEKSDLDDSLYRGMMRAMGYRNNQSSFLGLARAVDIKMIKRHISPYLTDEYPLVIQAMLLNSAGFLENVRSLTSDAETTTYLDALDSISGDLAELPAAKNLKWDFGGTRPANYPHRRIAGVSYILARQLGTCSSLVESVIDLLRLQVLPAVRIDGLRAMFSVGPEGYWSDRSSFSSRRFLHPASLVGAQRADDVIVNIVIPFAFLYCSRNEDGNLARAVMDFYRNFPALADNHITEFMRHRMFDEDTARYNVVVSTALRQQGLLQVFNDFCCKGIEGCENCGFNRSLMSGVHTFDGAQNIT